MSETPKIEQTHTWYGLDTAGGEDHTVWTCSGNACSCGWHGHSQRAADEHCATHRETADE